MNYYDIKQLRKKRLSLGMKSKEAADMLGISTSRMSHWELGIYRAPVSYLKKYAEVLNDFEATGPKRAPLYVPDGKYKNAVDRTHTLSLRRSIMWIGASFDEIGGMAGVPLKIFGRHICGRSRMTWEEHTAISNVLYNLAKERDKDLPKKLIVEARHMLTYYGNRVHCLHNLFTQAVMLKEGTDYGAQTYRAFRPSSGYHADPVFRRYAKIETLEDAISRLMAKMSPALQTYLELKNSEREEDREMFLVFERYYVEHESIEDIAEDTGISTRTLYRRKYELMCRIAKSAHGNAIEENGEK